MAPLENLMQNLMVLPASGTANALLHVPTKIRVANFWKEPRALLKRILIGVGTDSLEVIVHLVQAATFTMPLKRGRRRISLMETSS